jgi:deoxyribodipyrimidine photolyase-related protein
MGSTLFLFSHQLHPRYVDIALQHPIDKIVFVDSDDQWTYYRFHKQRILLHLSAMHHRVHELKAQGFQVSIIATKRLTQALASFPNFFAFTPTNGYEKTWLSSLPNVQLLDDPLFLISEASWVDLLPKHKPWKLDPLYRQFRKQFNILMQHDEPIGGQYSFDAANRKPPTKDLAFIPPMWCPQDALTAAIAKDVASRFPDHPGDTLSFAYPVTRADALRGLHHFMETRLGTFGEHQDAMLSDDPWMSHSLVSSSINLGLLSPLEIIQAAETAYHRGKAPIEATEGFIRQILGWREYVRGIYVVQQPDYLKVNHFHHHRTLPTFFYNANTAMHCLNTTIQETIDHAYNHHIQRLMILSNYANLAEVTPQALNRWFNEMYIDSSEWVVAANVLGMGLYADGGRMSTKPYVASGAYIDKMSNYCDQCAYQVTLKTGKKACPFNSLYWHFIAKNKDAFTKNPRMAMMVKVFDKMPEQTKTDIIFQAKQTLS